MRRPFSGSSTAWIALGVATLVALPPVRRALRTATVSAVVGAMRIGDTVRTAGQRVTTETRRIFEDASTERETMRHETIDPRSWLRDKVVHGVATTIDAADSVARGVRSVLNQREVDVETGAIGMPVVDDKTQRAANEWSSQAVADSYTVAEQKPEASTLTSQENPPQSAYQEPPRASGGVPSDFALRNQDQLKAFQEDVRDVGASLMPQYRNLLQGNEPQH
ncbi:hypothetical protein [Ferroacidibacillus organovorans]|uniref:Uncharacterized protein n=1 Tax=Ferroacidibacillus organovorans TaxID=1765683 RepID=A0A162UL26_9BACL|nr:hypothetical protein [Ferroacidibacillus organovorans]KYP81839.1 hypothetical protein AYJ22_05625 [Ferroacidibacillus organovorans]OAG94202.1 hypothetical protein AYW79_06750 [Ferroacidibacillus organovorans]OPG16234.1 hypothetical protein B2M26_07950 [Ferroacidibacillus organovorans]